MSFEFGDMMSIAGSLDELDFNCFYDPDEFDHLPIDDQLKLYKSRDLRPAKLYRCAAKIWGEPKSRTRRIVAPPMGILSGNTELSSGGGSDSVERFSDSIRDLCSAEGSVEHSRGPFGDQETSLMAKTGRFGDGEISPMTVNSYSKWLEERKMLRIGLESLGLSSEWLARKPDKTPVELRVLKRMKEEERKPLPTIQRKTPEADKESQRPQTAVTVPIIKCPSPEAVLVIERFLYERKLRLIDLFQDLDKNKNWRITTSEFRRAIQQNGVPLTEAQVEELMRVFSDEKSPGSLRYRDLVHSLEMRRREKRETRLAAEDRSSAEAEDEDLSAACQDKLDKTKDSGTPSSSSKPTTPSAHRTRSHSNRTNDETSSSHSTSPTLSRSSSSVFLQPPEPDLRPERMVGPSPEAMVDLRRRNQNSLHLYAKHKQDKGKNFQRTQNDETQKLMIKTGDRDVDGHCAPSTVKTDPAESIDRYRQLLLREYMQLTKLCKLHHLPMTDEILRKTLLHPEDKPLDFLLNELRHSKKNSTTSSKNSAQVSPDFTTSQRNSESLNSRITGSPYSFASGTTVFEVETPSNKETSMSGNTRDSGTNANWRNERGWLPQARGKGATAASRNLELAKSFPREKALQSGVSRNVRLSTGKAKISSKVDCWMSFEEFVQLTTGQNQSSKKRRKTHRSKGNAYWPGQLLDKLCLVLGNGEGQSVFHCVNSKHRLTNNGRAYNNNLSAWPINDSGYVQYGTITR